MTDYKLRLEIHLRCVWAWLIVFARAISFIWNLEKVGERWLSTLQFVDLSLTHSAEFYQFVEFASLMKWIGFELSSISNAQPQTPSANLDVWQR